MVHLRSEESAETKADAHHKEKCCFGQQGCPECFGECQIPAGDVALGAGADTGFAGDALAAAQTLLIQLQVDRAEVGTGAAARNALFPIAVELCKRQHWQE